VQNSYIPFHLPSIGEEEIAAVDIEVNGITQVVSRDCKGKTAVV